MRQALPELAEVPFLELGGVDAEGQPIIVRQQLFDIEFQVVDGRTGHSPALVAVAGVVGSGRRGSAASSHLRVGAQTEIETET